MDRFRLFRAFVTITAASSISGCQLIKYDLTRAGGASAYAGNAVLPAETSQMELFRAAEFLAILTEVGSESITDVDEQKLFVAKVVQTNTDIDKVYAMLPNDCATYSNTMQDGCKGLVEAYVPTIENDLLSVAKLALPVDQLQKVLSEAEKGNWLGTLSTALTAAGQLVVVFHDGAATRRSSIEIVMEFDNGKTLDTTTYTTFAKAEAAFVAQGDTVGTYTPNASALNSMYNLVQTNCDKLVGGMSSTTQSELADYINPQVAAAPASGGTPAVKAVKASCKLQGVSDAPASATTLKA